jgi:hypothetical protein
MRSGSKANEVYGQSLTLFSDLLNTDLRFVGGMQEYLRISFDHAQRVCEQLERGLRSRA